MQIQGEKKPKHDIFFIKKQHLHDSRPRHHLYLDLGDFLGALTACLSFVCQCFWTTELQSEKCGVMTEALSYGPVTWAARLL